jgi:ATP-dependent Lhr-like helicase
MDWAHPLVRKLFTARFDRLTQPQEQGWPPILAGKSTLISAPTGSGKTLAAFMVCIDRLVKAAAAGELPNETKVLYVSPLKALGNDIQKNLDGPLKEILDLAAKHGLTLPEIRTAVRTGDTEMSERRAMLVRPPHILVTTPESLYILLTADQSREMLRTVETVIVDEIHAVADDKRGAHLALSLERLEALTHRPPVRIGLSATQKPIETVAHFLTGTGRPDPVIVQIGHQRKMDLAIEVPGSELGPIATHELWEEVYSRIATLVGEHRSTLVFVNTRRLAERVAHHLAERLGHEAVATHHGSLARKLRLEAEQKLKHGEIKVLVATASLELGIDIGNIDLVCQIGSTRAFSVAWQRVGRAGHWQGAIPKGRFFATTREELIECASIVYGMRHGELDRLEIPRAPLDILAQQIVAMCAAEEWKEDELFDLVRRAYPFRELPRAEFDEIVEMLSEGIDSRNGRRGAHLHRDRINHRLLGRRGSRLTAITNGGAIPDNALYTVVAEPEGNTVGTVDEDFAVESLRGDIMLLGNSSWRIRRVAAGKVIVEDAQGAPPNVPFWRGEAPARTAELSQQVAALRERVSALTAPLAPGANLRQSPAAQPAIDWLQQECGLDTAGAEQIVEHIVAGRTLLGAVPTQSTLIAERFFDESGGMQLVIHAPFGGRINKAWGLALRKRFCRSFNLELQAAATEDGINISLAEQHSFPLADVFRFLHPNSVDHVLQQAVLASPIFTTRWRWDASRALVLSRFQGGKKVPPHLQRMRSDDLLAAVFPDAAACPENLEGEVQIPDHPLIREVMKDALTEAMDIDGLKGVLERILDGRITCLSVDTPMPSTFAHEILNANPYAYLDDAPLEERRARAVELRRALPEAVTANIGRLDPAVIAEVRAQAWPDIRDAEELHDSLASLIALPDLSAAPAPSDANDSAYLPSAVRALLESCRKYFQELQDQNRVARAENNGWTYWVTAEKAKVFQAIFPEALFLTPIAKLPGSDSARADGMRLLAAGWLDHAGPVRASALTELLGISREDVDSALLGLESQGAILRGHFAESSPAELEWCDRRLLARIHRLTLGALRREIEPVTPALFMRWLLEWQHVAPGSQLTGERGTLEVVRQLQGFEAPANAWEPQILARRIQRYDPGILDRLCLMGAVGWGRISPHPAIQREADGERRTVSPSSVAPIAFFARDDAEWMNATRPTPPDGNLSGLRPGSRAVLEFLRSRGASFFADIVRGAKRLKSEVEAGLWELVAAGFITADGFDNLRALIDPKRRAGQGRGQSARPRHSAGRWSILYPGEAEHRESAIEAICWVLLKRYGVVFREMVSRESIVPRWREMLLALRRLEARGEIRGGRFVHGFHGEQFALPVAVESLRAMRNRPASGETIAVAAADPLNLAGIIVPGDRVAANTGRLVAFRDGVVVPASLECGRGTAVFSPTARPSRIDFVPHAIA